MADEKDLVGDAADKAKDAAGDIVEKGKDVAEAAADKVGDAAGAVGDKAGDVVEGAKDLAGSAADKVGDAAGAVGDAAGDAVEGAKDLAGSAADKVGDAAGAVGDKAGDVVEGAKDLAGAAADKVGDAAGAVGDAAGDAVEGAKDLAGAAADKVGDAAGAVADKAGDAAAAVGDAAGDAVDAVKDVGGAAVDKAGDAAEAVGDAAGAAVDKGKEVLGDAAGAVSGAASGAADAVGGAFDSVSDAFDGDGDGDSILKWLIPLLLLAIVLVLGFMFCGPGKDAGSATKGDEKKTEDAKSGETSSATGEAVESSVEISAKDGKYTITGTVKDEETKANILKEAEAVWGSGNVDVDGLKVDANAKEFKEGWFDNFKNLLPDLKDWKEGSISWIGDTLKKVGDLPAAAVDKIKSLFSGWSLGFGFADAAELAKQANEKAMELLGSADSVEEVVTGLNATIINFDTGKSEVPESAKSILEKAAEVLKKQEEGTKIEVGGHTDNQGDASANQALSQARAESVMKALIDLGVSKDMLTAKGYGQDNPKSSNDTEEGRYQNRRIEYKVAGGGDSSADASTEEKKEDEGAE